jgi:hypothetical protein
MISIIQLLGYPHDYGNSHIGAIFTDVVFSTPGIASIHVDTPRLSVAEKVSAFLLCNSVKYRKMVISSSTSVILDAARNRDPIIKDGDFSWIYQQELVGGLELFFPYIGYNNRN